MYRNYMYSNDKKVRRAFLTGCQAMMDVFAHTSSNEIAAVLSRRDEGWIAMLCQTEEKRAEHESRAVACAIANDFNFDKAQLRGMLFNCACINDNGESVDENGKPCEDRPYPHKHYWSGDSAEKLSAEEFAKLSPEEQQECEEVSEIKLSNKVTHTDKWVSAHSVVVKLLIERMLREESPEMLDMYCKALESEKYELINYHHECFEELKSIHNSMHDMLGCILSTICDNCDCDEGETDPEEKAKD